MPSTPDSLTPNRRMALMTRVSNSACERECRSTFANSIKLDSTLCSTTTSSCSTASGSSTGVITSGGVSGTSTTGEEGETATGAGTGTGGGLGPVTGPGPGGGTGVELTSTIKRFNGAVELDPDSAALDFSNISEEVLQHFTSRTDMRVKISVEIEVDTDDNMDESLRRTVKENAKILKFKYAEFQKE